MSDWRDDDSITVDIDYENASKSMEILKSDTKHFINITSINYTCIIYESINIIVLTLLQNLNRHNSFEKTQLMLIVFLILSTIAFQYCVYFNIVLSSYFLLISFIKKYEFKFVYISTLALLVIALNVKTKQEMTKYQPENENFKISLNPKTDMDTFIKYDEKPLANAISSTAIYFNCRHCIFNPKINRITSKSSDIMVISEIGMGKVDDTTFRDIRTTGFRGKILLFTDNYRSVPLKVKRCGVFVIPITKRAGDVKFFQYARFPILYSILSKYSGSINRVIYYDSRDTLFQGDPFSFNDHSLQVSDEMYQFSKSLFSKAWLEDLRGIDISYFSNFSIVCSGVFGGYPSEVMKFSKLMTAALTDGYYPPCFDQIMFDFLIHSGITAKSGINVVRNPDFASIRLQTMHRTGAWSSKDIGNIHFTENGFIPNIVHQYDLDMLVTFTRACSR